VKTIEEITWEAEEEMARVARLAQGATGKRHNSLQDDSGSSEDDVGDGAPSGGYHSKYNR
jgi:hypothetical protein